MQKKYRKKILWYAKRSRYRSIWRRFVQAMACVVVFCTTYALILPAITMEQTHFCGLESHAHTADCYTRKETLFFTCTQAEGELHFHEDRCFDTQGNQICPYIEKLEHSHTESCYEGDNLICGKEEIQPHTHNENCIDENGVVICTKPELVSHEHREDCLTSEWEELLICALQTHIHDASCDSDPKADLETEEDWAHSVADVKLTGHWSEDLAAIAKSQIGYRESTRNYLLEAEGVQKGYSRYGGWYGVPYGRWDAMFVSFCLHYAGIPEEAIPRQSSSQVWFENLTSDGRMDTLPDADIAAGDVAFFGDETGSVDFAAIVTEAQWVAAENEEPVLYLQIVAGDAGDEVVHKQVTTADSILLGFVSTEKARQQYDARQPESAPEETEETIPDGRVTQVAETENYIVTVSYIESLVLPEGAELRVTEYSRDSEIFYQRCVQAGYELEWLMNIGFFLEDTELTLDGGFDVAVTSKQGDALGTDITHFAGEGTERISGESITEDGQASVVFTSDSFSDFGGGVAPAAEEHAPAAAAATANITLNFTSWSQWNPISFPNGNNYTCDVGSTITIVLSDSGANYSEAQVTVTGGELVSKTFTCGTPGCSHNNWCGTSPTHTIVVRATSANVTINGSVQGAGWTNNSVSTGGTTVPTDPPDETDPPTTPTQPSGPSVPGYPNYPEAVGTGEVNISRLRFYNICENGDSGISALAGCVFEIEGDNGYKTTVISSNTPEVNLPADIPDGNYTITEISAPDGYMRDTEYQRTFTVNDGMLVSDKTIGTFINHNLQQLTSGKTAEVEDYNNRIYQILLSAESHMRMYEMDPVDVLFVVDQSNSMLFPSGLDSTGKSVTLKLDGSGNVSNMEALNLDKNQVYYIISDPAGTSTVWAVWYNGQSWMYQDGSYYAKAWYNNGLGYQDPNERAIFPQNRSYKDQANAEADDERSNGGGLGFNLSGGGLGNYIDTLHGDIATFEVYTASSEYNRLHYLEEALTNMIYTLADVNDQNRVTLIEFTKEVDAANDCMGPLELTPDNVEDLIYEVRHINTSGGTRQDIALAYTYNSHLNNAALHYSGNPDDTYTILITDGAPVRSSGSALSNLGSPNDPPSTDADSIYAQIKGYAQLVRQKSTLMTVGLGMDKVEGGKQVLQQIATNENYNCALDDAAELVKQMQDLLFEAFRPKESILMTGDVIDEISDSFYPIAWTNADGGAATGRQVLVQDADQDWILLQSGDWITLEGRYTTAGASDAAGQLLRRDDGTFYIQWLDVQLSNPYDAIDPVGVAWVSAGTGNNTGRTVLGTYGGRDWIQLRSGDWVSQEGQYHSGTPSIWQRQNYGQYTGSSISWGTGANNGNNRILFDPDQLDFGWHGTCYVKAKEDFIGGNAINTNKSASIQVTVQQDDDVMVQKNFETPTVNVHLLDMNEMQSEVTVYLGDLINQEGSAPLDSVQYFFDNTVITKLISGGSDVLNKVTAESADGLEDGVFYLRYALGRDLTEAEWQTLASGTSITIPYIYDNHSSRGPVGAFTFRLEKNSMPGAEADFAEHEATAACQPGGNPLTEHCHAPAETYTLHITYKAYGLGENGRPVNNVHNGTGHPGTEVGTGDTLPTGLGTVTKKNVHEVHVISGSIKISKKFEAGLTDKADRTFTFRLHRLEDGEDTSQDVTKNITILMGESAGSSFITFNGLQRGTYTVTEAPDDRYTTGAITVLNTTNCHSEPGIGSSDLTLLFTMGNNVSNENVIGRTAEGDAYTSYIDPVNGVFGEAEFTNREIVYTGNVPVEKVWSDGPQMHELDTVYLVLYLDGVPVQDAQGQHRLLRLDRRNGWQGSFKVILADADDKVTNYDYSVREVSQVSEDTRYQDTWHKAILENNGSTLYYAKALEDGSILGVGNRGYMVHYTAGEYGAWTVTNNRAVELPNTGGMGTHLYTFSGLLLMAAGLIYGYSLRRRKERGDGR